MTVPTRKVSSRKHLRCHRMLCARVSPQHAAGTGGQRAGDAGQGRGVGWRGGHREGSLGAPSTGNTPTTSQGLVLEGRCPCPPLQCSHRSQLNPDTHCCRNARGTLCPCPPGGSAGSPTAAKGKILHHPSFQVSHSVCNRQMGSASRDPKHPSTQALPHPTLGSPGIVLTRARHSRPHGLPSQPGAGAPRFAGPRIPLPAPQLLFTI